MKFLINILLPFTIMLSAQAQNHNHSVKGHDHKLAMQMDQVLKSNDELFKALLGTDQTKVEAAARKLEKDLSGAKYPELSKLASPLSGIKKSQAKAKNIEVYAQFMPGLVEVFKQKNINVNYGLYYCPMEKKYWIQNTKETPKVRNVFAQDMLECGSKI